MAADLKLVAEGVQAMLTVYGFGAKTSSGFGVAALNDVIQFGIRADWSCLEDKSTPAQQPEFLNEDGSLKSEFLNDDGNFKSKLKNNTKLFYKVKIEHTTKSYTSRLKNGGNPEMIDLSCLAEENLYPLNH
ncbi:hypothetical protein [Leptothermofonsia sp. ETS-13]|uniref:hypothetical protein n=1 Tax=Leptothermofonsia sp. ETS-13 TaxID=3035696 RepID=UPI003BA0C8E7